MTFFKRLLQACLTTCIILVTFSVAYLVLTGVTFPLLLEPIVKKDPNWAEGPLLGGFQALPLFLLVVFFSCRFTVLILRLRKNFARPIWPPLLRFAGVFAISTAVIFCLEHLLGWL